MRAVAASLSVAVVGAIAYLIYDIALSRGATLPGGDLRLLALVAYTVLVLVIGSLVTYLVVPQPTGSGTVRRRSAWSAALGFFAAVPDRLAGDGRRAAGRPPVARLIPFRPTRVLLGTTKTSLPVRPGSLSVPFPGNLRRSHHPRVFRGRTGDVALIR